jgi:hypothetical protein
MTPTDATILAAVIGAITGLVGIIGTYMGATRNIKRQEFNTAAAIFRDAFLPEILLLDIRHAPEGKESKSAMEIIEPAIMRHTEAMLRFIPYLHWWNRFCFTHAWNQYAHYKVKGEPDTPYLAMYAEERWEGKDTKELALKRIEDILKFAKHK